MSKCKKRIYSSESRSAQAAITRSRILTAAKILFQKEGFESVTIEQIAMKSEVSQPTVYAIFQSKRGILRSLIDEALPPEEHAALVAQTKIEKCPKKRLKIAAKISRLLYDAERAQMDFLRGAFIVASELKELEKEREERRYHRLQEGIEALAAENAFRKGVSATKAHAILWAFTGRDLYRLFVVERGWSSDAYEKWLGETLIQSLLSED